MDSKQVIERLIKIADNQQKIITKLAQAAGMPTLSSHWEDVAPTALTIVHEAAKELGAKGQYSIESAQAGPESGIVQMKVHHSKTSDPREYYAMVNKIKEMMVGKPVQTVSGKEVPVKSVEIIGVSV